MPNLKKIIIISLVILTLGIAWKYYRKYKESDKLKIGDISLKPTEKIEQLSDLVNLFKNGLELEGFVIIKSFVSKIYTLNQFNIDCLTPETEKEIAKQTNIIQGNIEIKAQKDNEIPLAYKINILNTLALFKECGVIPKEATLWQVITKPEKYYKDIKLSNLKIKLKGFIEAEGITLNINQEQSLYA